MVVTQFGAYSILVTLCYSDSIAKNIVYTHSYLATKWWMVNRCPTRLPRVCAHCGGNHRVFARTRRIGHDIPQNTAHGFTALSTKICSRCNTRIHRDWRNPCDQCPPQSSAVRRSNSLIIAANAARQQMQSTLQTLPATLPTTAPVTSSIILPASVHAEIIDKELKKKFNSKKNNINFNNENQRIITIQKGNYEGSSQGMEGEAFKRCLLWLENKGILYKMLDFVSDQSTTVEFILKNDPRTQHVLIWNDPGHMALNFRKHLDVALGAAKLVKGMSSRMESWFITSIKLAEHESDDRVPEEILKSFTRRMSHFMWHYTGLCQPECPHKEQEEVNGELQHNRAVTSLSLSQPELVPEWSVEKANAEQERRKKMPSVARSNTVSSVSSSPNAK